MSSESVELVRGSFEAFARGDLDTAFAACHPDVEWRTAADEPDRQTYRGVPALRRFAATLAELWVGRFDGRMEFEEFFDRGDWVIAPWRARLRGRGSGIEVDVSETYAVLVRGAQIVRVEEYRTKEQALDAIGSRE